MMRDSSWLLPGLSGASLFYVLYVFEGFSIYTGPSDSGHSLMVRALLFGLATSLVFYAAELPFGNALNERTPLQKFLRRLLAVFIGVNVTFLLLNYFWSWQDLTWNVYSQILIQYPLVLLIPIALVQIIEYVQGQSKADMNVDDEKMILFRSENGKDQVCVSKGDLLFLKSAGNYTEVHIKYNDKIKPYLLRRTLSSIEKEFDTTGLLKRCHRSYLVNAETNKAVVKKGGKLALDFGLATIPISKSFAPEFALD